jgi:hypothetical protein
VTGLQAQVAIRHQSPPTSSPSRPSGADSISATGLASGAISEFLDGGDGNDTIAGGPGAGLLGGNGTTHDRRQRRQRPCGSAAHDTFVWDPGDGSDTIDGKTAGTPGNFPRRSLRDGRPVGEREPAAVLPPAGERHDGHRRSRFVTFDALGGRTA